MFKLSYRFIVSLLVIIFLTGCGVRAAPTSTVTENTTGSPSFTHPTEITNPLYPVSLAGRTISLGTEGGAPARVEVTLLPTNKVITWNGNETEARVVQFVAYTGGKLAEVAYDYFAQADDGSVYYMGEDVSNYANGKLVDHGGSWLAGKDGAPPALIMPAHPEVGQVFNPENLPGVVYETDEVLSLTEKANTPAGPINNALFVKETLMDGSIEHKTYAPNFGIVVDQARDEKTDLVLFVPSDAKPRTMPAALSTLEAQAEDIMDVAPTGNWEKVNSDVAAIDEAWQGYKAQAATDKVPQPFQDALTEALDRLQEASTGKDSAGTLQAANDLSAAVVDISTFYQPAEPIDLGSLDVLERQVVFDTANNDLTAAADSLAKVNAVWGRLKPIVLAHNGADVATQFENSLATQQKALDKKDASALTTETNNGLELVDALEQLF